MPYHILHRLCYLLFSKDKPDRLDDQNQNLQRARKGEEEKKKREWRLIFCLNLSTKALSNVRLILDWHLLRDTKLSKYATLLRHLLTILDICAQQGEGYLGLSK